MFYDVILNYKIFNMNELEEFIITSTNNLPLTKSNKKVLYYNVPCAFDIETSSFYENDSKRAIMYVWQFGLNGYCIYGRTWEEFLTLLNELSIKLELTVNCRLVCYVHNLGYEFQWLRKWLEWDRIFSIDVRKPIYAVSSIGVEFRCSYLLSGYSLEILSKNLLKYKIDKKVGDLEYKLIRHSNTELTEIEMGYCINDIKVVMCYIMEQIEDNKYIHLIPITKTGFVRRYCREQCFNEDGVPKSKSKKYKNYSNLMRSLTVESHEYEMLKRAFQGGFTHASIFNVNKLLYNVASFDFTSSYPTVMIAERFPMGKGEYIKITTKSQFIHNLKCYCCVFDIHIIGLKPKRIYENYISISHCYGVKKPIVNNGRIVSADELYTTITDIDFRIIKDFYEWDRIEIGDFIRYQRGYLPKDLIISILDLYSNKTKLKDVVGKEREYLSSKEMLNAVYGCCVTDIVRDDIIYNNEWYTEKGNNETLIEKYNKSRSRFLFYPWGVFVCAYARYNVFSGIKEFGDTGDYVYCDTDSVKVLNYERHIKYIEDYNSKITDKLERTLDFYNIEHEYIKPKTIKGVEKPLGVWDFEGIYDKFKTLGAKRYMFEKEGKLNITVSGLNKKITVPYILDSHKNPFDFFDDGMYIPKEKTGKNTHTYIDDDMRGIIKDYQGAYYEYYEKSGVHLEGSDYSLSLSSEYASYIKQVRMEID